MLEKTDKMLEKIGKYLKSIGRTALFSSLTLTGAYALSEAEAEAAPYQDEGQLTLAWDPFDHPQLEGYRLHWNDREGSGWVPTDLIDHNGSCDSKECQFVLTGLEEGKVYDVKANCYDIFGNPWRAPDNSLAYSNMVSGAASAYVPDIYPPEILGIGLPERMKPGDKIMVYAYDKESGIAEVGIEGIRANRGNLYWELSAEDLGLPDGEHSLLVVADDKAGNYTTRTVDATYNSSPPEGALSVHTDGTYLFMDFSYEDVLPVSADVYVDGSPIRSYTETELGKSGERRVNVPLHHVTSGAENVFGVFLRDSHGYETVLGDSVIVHTPQIIENADEGAEQNQLPGWQEYGNGEAVELEDERVTEGEHALKFPFSQSNRRRFAYRMNDKQPTYWVKDVSSSGLLKKTRADIYHPDGSIPTAVQFAYHVEEDGKWYVGPSQPLDPGWNGIEFQNHELRTLNDSRAGDLEKVAKMFRSRWGFWQGKPIDTEEYTVDQVAFLVWENDWRRGRYWYRRGMPENPQDSHLILDYLANFSPLPIVDPGSFQRAYSGKGRWGCWETPVDFSDLSNVNEFELGANSRFNTVSLYLRDFDGKYANKELMLWPRTYNYNIERSEFEGDVNWENMDIMGYCTPRRRPIKINGFGIDDQVIIELLYEE